MRSKVGFSADLMIVEDVKIITSSATVTSGTLTGRESVTKIETASGDAYTATLPNPAEFVGKILYVEAPSGATATVTLNDHASTLVKSMDADADYAVVLSVGHKWITLKTSA